MGQPFFPINFPLPTGDLNPHLIHGSLGPPKSSTPTASWLVRAYLQGSLVRQTDRQTDHTTRSVVTGRIYVCSTAMQPNNNTEKLLASSDFLFPTNFTFISLSFSALPHQQFKPTTSYWMQSQLILQLYIVPLPAFTIMRDNQRRTVWQVTLSGVKPTSGAGERRLRVVSCAMQHDWPVLQHSWHMHNIHQGGGMA